MSDTVTDRDYTSRENAVRGDNYTASDKESVDKTPTCHSEDLPEKMSSLGSSAHDSLFSIMTEKNSDRKGERSKNSGSVGESLEFRDSEAVNSFSSDDLISNEYSVHSPVSTVISPLSSMADDQQVYTLDTTESLMSREDSSLAWLREASKEEEFVSAGESPASTASTDSSRSGTNTNFKHGELVNKLVEGPSITLPLTQLPILSMPEPPNGGSTPLRKNDPCPRPIQQSGDTRPVPKDNVHMISGDKRPSSEGVSTGSNKVEPSRPVSSPVEVVSRMTPNKEQPVVNKATVKKTPNDFIFGKVIGEGSYSTVYLAKEVSSQKEFAIKVCDKKHLIRERKTHFVMREKEVLMKLNHPFFIKLVYTFQDQERLYYVLTYARNGELLGYMHKLSAFDVACTRFYTAEIVLALDYLHSLGIIHRDLKPENILLNEDMHIKIIDFGTSKILSSDAQTGVKRKNSFVGTAEYVSPEVLNNQPANCGSDLWGLGCIVYQCLSGSLPFRSGNEYQTFQKIVKVEYEFPEGFNDLAKDLVQRLLVLESSERLGMHPADGMSAVKRHPFYNEIDWERLHETTPPKLMPYLPATADNPEFWGQEQRTGFDDQRLAEIITGQSAEGTQSPELEQVTILQPESEAEDEKKKEKLRKQRQENQFHQFVEDNLILRQGFVNKRKGLFSRKRMLLLTEGPHLYYVDAHNKVLKGEIPWSEHLRPEAKNFKIFFVHTPNRTYYLESRMPDAHLWVKKIEEVWEIYYGDGT